MDAKTSPLQSKSVRFRAISRISCRSRSFFAALLIAVTAVFWCHLLITTWGFGSIVGLGGAVGLLIATALPGIDRTWSRSVAAGTLTLLTALSPTWWPAWHSASMTLVSATSGTVAVGLLHALLLAVLCYAARCSLIPARKSGAGTSTLLGLTAGLALGGIALPVALPTYWTAAIASCLLLTMHLATSNRSALFATRAKKRPQSVRSESLWVTASLAIILGLLIPTAFRYLAQLQPESTFLFYCSITALLFGAFVSARFFRNASLIRLAAVIVVLYAAFPLWIRAYLVISATISIVPLAMLTRALAIHILLMPVGILAGRVLISCTSSGCSPLSRLLPTAAFLVAFAIAPKVLTVTGLPVLMLACCGGLVLLATRLEPVSFNWSGLRERRGVFKRVGFGAAGAAAAAMPWLYDPALSARTLFSTNSFIAWHNGTGLDELAGLDDSRLMKIEETPDGTLSYWKHQGTHVQIRMNGIPQGRISLNDEVVPQPTGTLLSAVLPLSFHPAPRDVLLLGLEGGLALETALEFPVINVQCCDANSRLWSEMKEGLLAPAMDVATADDRVRFSTTAGYHGDRKYDVIIESPHHSASYRAAHEFNEIHYQEMSQLLSENGIYCQRFVFTDYGPGVLASLAKTLQRSFGYMTAFDTAPGELLFVAARNKENVLAEGLIDRISAPQVQRSLARVGWDWSIAMNLARFELEDLDDARDFGPASVFRGTEAFGRYAEMMRWADKWNEVRNLLAAKPRRLMNHYAGDKAVDDILRRLSDVAAREQVLENHPDEFWVYRKSVKKRLQDNPRSIIEPVKGEGLQQKMHPEDRRRIAYFESLGKATQETPCTLSSLTAVEDFEAPYDPLISHFMHAEIAKLYQRCEPAQPDRELRHWLHAVHFGGRKERSVRGIHRSLELLNGDVNLPDEERYDQMNALLEVLKVRWQMRRGKTDISQPVLLIDLQDSIEACQQSLTTMGDLASRTSIDETEFESRKKHIERTLTRYLRSYRTEMLAKSSRPVLPPRAAAK
ncbi:hypothetical protein [Rubinisphaera margarita]|uniref:hypothetical protein n=1 Tax=Rubinisphaera margarita TaxID=2909586 RepID=UPI001EE96121|nr:hypothetical protein [Rubinisphaera margarita]MCG6155154.1 hypothetical protein [Rubinisphaera margarita]